MTANITLTKATLADMDYLLALRKLTMAQYLEGSGVFYNDAQHKVRIMNDFDCFHLLQFDGELVGGLKYFACDKTLKVMQLQIHPDFQKQGRGGQVFHYLFARYPSLDFYLTVLKNNPAKGLYLRLGFEQYGEDDLEYHLRRLR